MILAAHELTIGRAALGKHFDELLETRWRPAMSGLRVCSLGGLPVRLERYVRSLSPDFLWRAYRERACLWLAVALAWKTSTFHPAPLALEVHFFAADGTLSAGGVWEFGRDCDWRLADVFDVAADDSR